jgi:hypothetical protein
MRDVTVTLNPVSRSEKSLFKLLGAYLLTVLRRCKIVHYWRVRTKIQGVIWLFTSVRFRTRADNCDYAGWMCLQRLTSEWTIYFGVITALYRTCHAWRTCFPKGICLHLVGVSEMRSVWKTDQMNADFKHVFTFSVLALYLKKLPSVDVYPR